MLLMALLAGACTDAPSNQVVAETLNYRVKGMHCQGCVDAIRAEVELVPGVISCRVDLPGSTAQIDVSEPAAESKVEAAIKKLGYTAERDSP